MDSTDKLIARLEAAPVGSRELNEDIACSIGVPLAGHKSGDFYSLAAPWQGWENSYPLPHYTTSLDAALTLVPEGWHLEITGEQGSRGWGVRLTSGTLAEAVGLGSTAALALCIAALKAHRAAPASPEDAREPLPVGADHG